MKVVSPGGYGERSEIGHERHTWCVLTCASRCGLPDAAIAVGDAGCCADVDSSGDSLYKSERHSSLESGKVRLGDVAPSAG